MKLTEPLSGIKLIQGHFVMHLALFLCSSICVDTHKYQDPTNDFMKNDVTKLELEIFYYLHYGHLVTAIL
jgi:hypothetical protein